MSIGELLGDTLGAREQDFILRRAEHDLPAHDLALYSNDDGVTWAVLTPPAIKPELLRFTICRIEPCVVVMVEDEEDRRRFLGLGSIEEALDFVLATARRAVHSVDGMQTGNRVLH